MPTQYTPRRQIGVPLYLMTAWQVFSMKSALTRQVLRWHGCFSVDREAADMRAFRQAVEVLERRREPLVVFPEGEVYHCNGRVRPFREGAAAIALSAAKRDKRPVVCVPCALWYEYLDDPTEELKGIMNDLEREVLWRPRTDLPLHERIYRFAEVCLVIKELEFLGRACEGPLPGRILNLADKILRNIEARRGLPPRWATCRNGSRNCGISPFRSWRRTASTSRLANACTRNWRICFWPSSCSAIREITWRRNPRWNGWRRRWTSSKKTC